jgi:hypothetical protein
MIYREAEIRDIPGIILLEKKYHINSISEEDKPDGYIGTFFSESKLKRLIKEENLSVACDGDKVVGFAGAASWQFWASWPVFQVMIDDLPNIEYKGRILSANNSYQYGPVSIDKEYRGTEVLPNLFDCSRLLMKERFPVLITYVSKTNPRSFQAHSRKLGLEFVKEFEFHDKQLYVLCYDTSVKTIGSF